MRNIGRALLLLFGMHMLLPVVIVVDFLIDRERIMEDLCVQRIVPDEMRTCHGDCYLSKQLKKVDQREQGLPATLRALKPVDALPFEASLIVTHDPASKVSAWGIRAFGVLMGHVPPRDPVPWC